MTGFSTAQPGALGTPDARAASAPHAGGPALERAGEQLRRAVAAAAQPAETSSRTRDEFPDFDDNLRQAFRHETEMFFDSILREDRSVLDLLTRRLHIRERAAGAALRDTQYLWQPVPARAGHTMKRAAGCWGKEAFSR